MWIKIISVALYISESSLIILLTMLGTKCSDEYEETAEGSRALRSH
jgi:hypothetical protein